MEERRKYPRYYCSQKRKFTVMSDNTDRLVGEVRDFSRGGIRFSSLDDIREKEQIKLLLQVAGLAQKTPVTIQIVWKKDESGSYTYGARLVQISPSSKFDIMDLLYQDWKRQEIMDFS